MASPGQQMHGRKYVYGYNGKTGYTRLLKEAHRVLVTTIENQKDVVGAEKLRQFLQAIKDTASGIDINGKNLSAAQQEVANRLGQLTEGEKAWYADFVNNVINTQTNQRIIRGFNKLEGTFLRRPHGAFYEARDKELFDDIAEEELGYIFLEVKKRVNGDNYQINDIATGTGMSHIRGSSYFDKIGDDLYNHFVDEFKARAQRLNQRYDLGNQLKKEVRGKVDLQQGSLHITTKSQINEQFFKDLIPYLNKATFTVKNYMTTTFEDWGLSLGHTNFYKSIIAELNTVFPRNHVNWQRDIFYRGAQILTKTNTAPSASEDLVEKHFSHMRFIYELTGLGLLDSKGKHQFAKYLIFNDPISYNIYVQDTASIILNEINKRKSSIQLFGAIHLHNIKGYKK